VTKRNYLEMWNALIETSSGKKRETGWLGEWGDHDFPENTGNSLCESSSRQRMEREESREGKDTKGSSYLSIIQYKPWCHRYHCYRSSNPFGQHSQAPKEHNVHISFLFPFFYIRFQFLFPSPCNFLINALPYFTQQFKILSIFNSTSVQTYLNIFKKV
jgi:hypothetical protein